MSPADRELVINRLRLVASEFYSGRRENGYVTLHRNGICYAMQHAGGTPFERGCFWYRKLGDAFELLGMDRDNPFAGEGHGDSGDWAVRPLFCLLMADALEQME